MAKRHVVLSDHKHRGKILIPPFVDAFGPPQEVSWVNTIIPEIIWIGLIQHQHGHRDSVKLITSMVRTARSINSDGSHQIFAAASNYSDLSMDQWSQFREKMAVNGELFPIQKSLEPLINFYPECPLNQIFANSPTLKTENSLPFITEVVSSLYDRFNRDSTMIQATAVWLAFDSGLLKVNEGLALSHFPEIQYYPDTELSRQIGSGIRSTLNIFFGSGGMYSHESSWPGYFWNHGLSITPCEFCDD